MLEGVLTYPGGCRIPSTAAFLSAEFTFLQVGLAVANEQLTSLDVQLRSCSVLRTLEEPEQSVVQDVVRTPARSPLAIVSGEKWTIISAILLPCEAVILGQIALFII